MRLILFATLLALFPLSAVAQPDATPLEFTRLDLLDGRKLRNVVVKSIDHKTGRVLLVADKKALTVSLDLIPPPFAEKLRRGAPTSGSSMNTVASTTRREANLGAAPSIAQSRTYAASAPQSPAPPPAPAIDLSAHQTAVMERARQYYLAELRPGSVPSYTQVHQIRIDTPEPVTGWSGRYRTQGTAEIEHFARGYRSLGKVQSTFEVITEQKPGDPVTVIDFSRKT